MIDKAVHIAFHDAERLSLAGVVREVTPLFIRLDFLRTDDTTATVYVPWAAIAYISVDRASESPLIALAAKSKHKE